MLIILISNSHIPNFDFTIPTFIAFVDTIIQLNDFFIEPGEKFEKQVSSKSFTRSSNKNSDK